MRAASAALFVLIALACGPAAAQTSPGLRLAQEAAKAQAQGNLNGALGLYNEALADASLSNDRRATILTDRGALYARLNQPKLAIDDLNRAVQLYPEYPAIYNNRGSTLLALGLQREAIKDFDRAAVLAPGYAAAFNNRAAAYADLKQTAAAVADYTRAIELAPQSVAPLNGRGRVLLDGGRPQAAVRDFSRAIAVDTRFSLGYRSRADAKMQLERFADAAEDLSRAIAFDPEDADIYVRRGLAYLAARNTEAAIKDFARAIELDPRSSQAYAARALTHARINAAAEAEADVARALELDPRSALAYTVRAYTAVQAGQTEVARRELDRAFKLAPENADVLWVKGMVEEVQGRATEAVQSYRNALAARPGFREAADALDRLGAGVAGSQTEVRGLGFDPWYVVQRGTRYFAVSQDFARISVPLEMAGEGQPKLLDWEVRKPPYRDIALLRFSGGQIPGRNGPVETEQVAILDLAAAAVVAVVPHREGEKRARWTWEDGNVTIEGVDGLKDEFALRQSRVVASAPKRMERSYAPPSWGLWGDAFGGGLGPAPAPTKGSSRPTQRRQPKSLFDILLGN
jgi:tetratricopeptide (TPR) repeat protein